MVNMASIECASCGSEFTLNQNHPYHAGFSDMGFLYCDKDTTVVTWNDITDTIYRELVGTKAPWALTVEQKETVENALKSCPCGGEFKFRNPLRCPKCNATMKEGISEESIYVYILGVWIDGEITNIWK
jgi:hypothetical protein